MVVVGPEGPIVAGAAEAVRGRGRMAFGPDIAAARLEGSKAWMKEIAEAAGIPTAKHATFGVDGEDAALAYLDTMPGFYVVKTDGLAGGKGVFVTESINDARDAVRAYLSGAAFGAAGRTVVIEEGMTGPELSLLAVCTGDPDGAVPARAGPGLQAHRRARRRPEHRRHGRVLTGAARGTRRRNRAHGRVRVPDACTISPRRAPVTAACSTPG